MTDNDIGDVSHYIEYRMIEKKHECKIRSSIPNICIIVFLTQMCAVTDRPNEEKNLN